MTKISLADTYLDVPQLLHDYHVVPEHDWLVAGEVNALKLLNEMRKRVPAYARHLHELPDDFANLTEAARVLPIDKDNYLRANNRSDLCWDGAFKGQAWVVSATSGSTGVPYYFPRQSAQDTYYAITAEAYLRENFAIQDKTTLYINAFPMGVWIGGLFTYEAIKQVAEKGYPLSIITPGINKPEVIKAVQNLGRDFDQIIIGSYAPFLKDILDDGTKSGLDWKEYPVKFIFSAEAFSEEFRDYLQRKTGLKDIYKDTLNHYGTVDLGTMAHETPISILIRRLAIKNKPLYEELFNNASKLPTLAQYDPSMFYFEENEGNLYCSSYSGLPLFRYDLKDRGGILRIEQIKATFQKHGLNLEEEVEKAGIAASIWNLPFVYVFERSDFSVSFFAFQVYPETVRKALLEPDLEDILTGKCTLNVDYDEEGTQHLYVHIELAIGTKSTEELQARVTVAVTERLLEENSEYRKTSEEVGVVNVTPIVTLWEYGHDEHFKAGGKHKWVKK